MPGDNLKYLPQNLPALRRIWISLVRFGFYLLYHQLAWTYDGVSWLVSMGSWRDWQRATLPFIHGPRVLEIAHGPGHMLLALNEAGYQVVGIDLSPQMSRLAQKRLRRASQPPELLNGPAQTLPFRTATFNSVLTTFPTEFVAEPETLSAVFRVLKTNGRFVILPEAQLSGASTPVRVIEWLFIVTGQRCQPFPEEEIQQPFLQEHPGLLKQRLLDVGFHVDVKNITLVHSSATVIVATKPDI